MHTIIQYNAKYFCPLLLLLFPLLLFLFIHLPLFNIPLIIFPPLLPPLSHCFHLLPLILHLLLFRFLILFFFIDILFFLYLFLFISSTITIPPLFLLLFLLHFLLLFLLHFLLFHLVTYLPPRHLPSFSFSSSTSSTFSSTSFFSSSSSSSSSSLLLLHSSSSYKHLTPDQVHCVVAHWVIACTTAIGNASETRCPSRATRECLHDVLRWRK